MSMASSPQHEPTMEEILASIRKIISEDSTDAPPAPAAAAADSDVLELTQEVHDEPVVAAASAPIVAPPPAPPPAEPVVAAAPPQAEPPQPVDDVVFQTIEEEVPVSSEAQAVTPHEGIFSDKTRRALEDSFANIRAPKADEPGSASAEQHHAPADDGASVQAVFERAVRDGFGPVLHNWLGDNSDAVVEKLKPLVREWMDEHFPALLEGAVRAEVERVARARH
jgi:cell pole-organizing protein PopZ